jgi:exonuclease III
LFLDNQKIDICLIAETHLTNQNYITFNGYIVYTTAHPANTSRGGSAIIIKKEISHIMENKYEKDKMQSIAVKIRTEKQNITIAAAYCPPGGNLKQENYQEFFATLGERFILRVDYNAKNTQWGSRLTTTKGRELMKAINSTYYILAC